MVEENKATESIDEVTRSINTIMKRLQINRGKVTKKIEACKKRIQAEKVKLAALEAQLVQVDTIGKEAASQTTSL